MGPVAAGASVLLATFVIIATLVGAFAGALCGWSERGLVRGGLGSVGLLVLLALVGPSGTGVLLFGLPPLGCAFLIACLVARGLRGRGLHPVLSTVVALASVLTVGALYVMTLRHGVVLPTLLAAVGSLILAAVAAWPRGSGPDRPSAPSGA